MCRGDQEEGPNPSQSCVSMFAMDGQPDPLYSSVEYRELLPCVLGKVIAQRGQIRERIRDKGQSYKLKCRSDTTFSYRALIGIYTL